MNVFPIALLIEGDWGYGGEHVLFAVAGGIILVAYVLIDIHTKVILARSWSVPLLVLSVAWIATAFRPYCLPSEILLKASSFLLRVAVFGSPVWIAILVLRYRRRLKRRRNSIEQQLGQVSSESASDADSDEPSS